MLMCQKEVCSHCGAGRVTRPRGLCWTCYYRPGVRELYPPVSKFGRRGSAADLRQLRRMPALEPTLAAPGTPEKLLVLMRRAELGQDLWHPRDAGADGAGVHLLDQAG